jgi:hypothetical protein
MPTSRDGMLSHGMGRYGPRRRWARGAPTPLCSGVRSATVITPRHCCQCPRLCGFPHGGSDSFGAIMQSFALLLTGARRSSFVFSLSRLFCITSCVEAQLYGGLHEAIPKMWYKEAAEAKHDSSRGPVDSTRVMRCGCAVERAASGRSA